MPVVSSLERRGAVYYWRRRIPEPVARRLRMCQVRISLRTKEPAEARFLAAHLDAAAEQLFMPPSSKDLSRDQLTGIFRRAFETHRKKLDRYVAHMRQDGDLDIAADRAEDRPGGMPIGCSLVRGKMRRSTMRTANGSAKRG